MGTTGTTPVVTLKRAKSVHALTPDRRWLRPSWAFPLFGAAWVLTMTLCCLGEPTAEFLRLWYTLVAVGLMLYRVFYYARKEWILYFIDLCFVNSILLVWSLWRCPVDITNPMENMRCSPTWWWSVFIVATGPVAGAVFPLQTPLTLHHPEGFESFFLHASPMWICYAIRWRWDVGEAVPGSGPLLWAGLTRIYLPWLTAYMVFLVSQPFMPDLIAGYETLMDLFLFPSATAEERLIGKRKGFKTYVPNVLKCVTLHAVLSVSGFAAAALCFQSHTVHVVWIGCVMIGCLDAGFRFYKECAGTGYKQPGLHFGFLRMVIAWALILPTYFLTR